MKKIIAFNWKMEPQSFNKAKKLFSIYSSFKKSNIIICPPFVYLNELKNLKTKNLKLGSQNVFWENDGYYTGEISPKMLKNLGVEYVIIGHSERRRHLNEIDGIINKKVLAALENGLKVILCVGENLDIRKKGKIAVENFIKSQLQKGLKNSKFLILNSKLRNHLMIAYEPIWAIGANHSDTPKDALEIIKFIKKIIAASGYTAAPKVLYGGSVDDKNIKNFLEYNEIDGFLIGHASLQPQKIKNIIKSI